MSETAQTATPQTASPPDFAAFEAAENAKALGHEPPAAEPAAPEPPAAEPEPDAADEPTAPPAADAPVVEAKDKSYTPPKPGSKRSQREQEHINARIRESVSEATKTLQAEIAALKARTTADPAAKVEPEVPPAPVVDPADPMPTEDDIGTKYQTYPELMTALAKWTYRQEKREDQAREAAAATKAAEDADARAYQEKAAAWITRRDAFAAKTPEFVDKALPFLNAVMPGTPIGDVILESEVGPEVALYLATHLAEAERIARLPPVAALRTLGKLEALYDSTLTSASASAGPAAKTVTTAPAPPTTLAARSAAPADPVAAAVARGDFSAFEEAENRKALAGVR